MFTKMKKNLVLMMGAFLMITMAACSDQELTDTVEVEVEAIPVQEEVDSTDSMESQLAIFAEQRDVWIEDLEYANERYCYTLADLSHNGKLTLIVSNCGGTGNYTYNRFYQIDDEGNMIELQSPFIEDDSQPDLIDEGNLTAYSNLSETGMFPCYIVHDMVRVSAANYVYGTGALSIVEDTVTYTQLAIQEVSYEGEDATPVITCEDYEGNSITEEEYNQVAETYYSNLGYVKEEMEISLEWLDVSSIAGLSDEAAVEELRKKK